MIGDMKSLDVVHNKDASRFESDLGDDIALLNYIQRGDVISFMHTGVPPAFRGQGIAARMTGIALDYARSKDLTVVPRCSYTADYIHKHPEYQILVED